MKNKAHIKGLLKDLTDAGIPARYQGSTVEGSMFSLGGHQRLVVTEIPGLPRRARIFDAREGTSNSRENTHLQGSFDGRGWTRRLVRVLQGLSLESSPSKPRFPRGHPRREQTKQTKWKRRTKAEIKRAIELWAQGLSPPKIAKQLAEPGERPAEGSTYRRILVGRNSNDTSDIFVEFDLLRKAALTRREEAGVPDDAAAKGLRKRLERLRQEDGGGGGSRTRVPPSRDNPA